MITGTNILKGGLDAAFFRRSICRELVNVCCRQAVIVLPLQINYLHLFNLRSDEDLRIYCTGDNEYGGRVNKRRDCFGKGYSCHISRNETVIYSIFYHV